MQATNNTDSKLVYRLRLSARWRRRAMTQNMLADLEDSSEATLKAWDCEMIEFSREEDHTRILFKAVPGLEVSQVVNALKSVHWGDDIASWADRYGTLTVV